MSPAVGAAGDSSGFSLGQAWVAVNGFRQLPATPASLSIPRITSQAGDYFEPVQWTCSIDQTDLLKATAPLLWPLVKHLHAQP